MGLFGFRGHLVFLAAALLGALTACSSGGSNSVGGSGGAGPSAGGGGGTAGSPLSDAAGTGGSSSGTGGATPSEGGAPDGPAVDGAGPAGGTSCAGRAISLATNGTANASDAAAARVVIDLGMDSLLGNVPRTIEFWFYVKPTDWVAELNEIFVLGGPAGAQQQLGLDFGKPPVMGMPMNHATLNPYTDGFFDDDTGIDLGITSTDTQWIHVAMTWDMTALRTFVNGVERITTKATGMQMLKTTMGPLVMGCTATPRCFNGFFDELRVWSVARTPDEIIANYKKGAVGNEPGLVGYWKFDDAPGSAMAADSVTTAGHTAHPGVLMSAAAAGVPTFVMPDMPSPVACP